jgi:hypothetical protein
MNYRLSGISGDDHPMAWFNLKGLPKIYRETRESRYIKMEMYQLGNLYTLSSDMQGGILVDRPD